LLFDHKELRNQKASHQPMAGFLIDLNEPSPVMAVRSPGTPSVSAILKDGGVS